ncbi:7158_t:CDS:2 [Racocetra persica]|uniref:7158_t:CDS:1 n=1 Tax=Racocetra persica TaxID=160502 RepID=A0ACA9MXR7_9GLOM|nr:7158_t:CDS:2 [Racocetra persica]
MSLNLETFLLKDIKNLFNDPNYSNVVIHVGRHPDTNSFNAHSLILRARSSYFRSALKTNNGQVSTLKLPDISPRVFECILKIPPTKFRQLPPRIVADSSNELFKVEKKSIGDGDSRKRTRIEDEEDELDFD